MTNRDEFLAERRSGIGGSDIAHVFSLEPYYCARLLWYQKRGTDPDRGSAFEVTQAMIRGQKLEDLVAEEYAERTGRRIEAAPVAHHPDFPQWMCHRDFIVYRKDRPDPGPLSVKTANREVFFRIKREGMPEAYILQLQSEMGVTDAQWSAYALLWPDGWQLLQWDVDRNDGLCARIRDECLKFWSLVENGPAPERLPPEDARCHRCPYSGRCQGAAMEELMRAAGAGAVVDRTLGPLVREFLDTKSLVDEAEEIHKGVKENLKAAMGDRVLVEVPGVAKVHFAPNREWDTGTLEVARPDLARTFRTKWDLTALGKAHPELEKAFKRIGTTRPLRIYPAR